MKILVLGATGTLGRPVDFFRTKHAIEQALRARGRVDLIGPGTQPRNVIAATDVARVAARALREDPPPFVSIDLGGPDHASNAEVTALCARAAVIAALAAPLHPDLSRIMRFFALPDDAFSERFDGAQALEGRLGFRLTRLQDFAQAQVAARRQGGGEA